MMGEREVREEERERERERRARRILYVQFL